MNKGKQFKPSISEDPSLEPHNHKILQEAGERKEALPEFTRDQVMLCILLPCLSTLLVTLSYC